MRRGPDQSPRAWVSDYVVCITGEATRAKSPSVNKGKTGKGQLADKAWTYASHLTQTDILQEVTKVGQARMKLMVTTSNKGLVTRVVRIGPMPRVRPGKTGVLSDTRMIQLTAEACDWLPPDFRDAITPESVLFSSMWPRNGSNRTLPEGHVQRENHDRLMIGLQEHPILCVRQFGHGYNIDAIHLVTIYNALVTTVGNWDRAVVVASLHVQSLMQSLLFQKNIFFWLQNLREEEPVEGHHN
jgi:hypothetical protein